MFDISLTLGYSEKKMIDHCKTPFAGYEVSISNSDGSLYAANIHIASLQARQKQRDVYAVILTVKKIT